MSNDVHKFTDEVPVVRQSSLTGDSITFKGSPVTNSTKLVMGTISRVYYQHNTCDVTLDDSGILLKSDESYDEGSISVPLPVDFYGYNDQNQPFVRPRLVKEGMRVLVGFINGETSHPIVIGVYPDDNSSYELISPNNFNEISDYNKDIQDDVMNTREITPSQTIIYQGGNGNFARSMQGHSFALVDDNTNGYLDKIDIAYEDLKYFQKKNAETGNFESIESEDVTAPAWLLVHESNDSDTHVTRFYVNKQGEFQVLFFDRFDFKNLVILSGSKDNGFTVTRQFDTNGIDDNSKDYVTFNVGKDKSISMSASSPTDSKEQSSSLSVKSDGVYLNDTLLFATTDGSSDNSGLLDNMASGNTGNKTWDDFQKSIIQAAQEAKEAAQEAKQAGEQAKQAGIDAEAAGQKAETLAKDTQNKVAYYLSISDNADVYVPQKYLIIDTSTFIKDGTIQSAHIQDAAITSANIRDAAITSAKIADLAVGKAQIGYEAVGTSQIENAAITDAKVGHLSFDHMEGEQLDADKINVINLKGQSIEADTITADHLKINNLGEITSQLGTVGNGVIKGSDIVGSTLHLADSYNNLFYDKSMSRAQYDNYGFVTGYSLIGPRINNAAVMQHCAGVRECSNQYLAMSLSRNGYYDNSGVYHDSSTDICTYDDIVLLGLTELLHVQLSNGPSNIFNQGGTRRIVFYDQYQNVTGYKEFTGNYVECLPPTGSRSFTLSIYVGNNGASTWQNATKYGNFTASGSTDTSNEDSVVVWQGLHNIGYDVCSFEYGGTDSTRLGEGQDSSFVQYLQIDATQLHDGDIVVLKTDINYDCPYSKQGSRFYMTVNGKSESDSSDYFNEDNEQYAIVGNYKYTWYFTYKSELGDTLTFNLGMKNQFYASRWYVTDSNEIIHPANKDYDTYGNYYGQQIIQEGAINTLSSNGEFRQTYHNLQNANYNNGNITQKSVSHMKDIQMYQGYLTFQSQNIAYNSTTSSTTLPQYDDFSAVYLSGSGLSFVGDFNKHYVDPYMYSGNLTQSPDDNWQGGAALTFWGNISHESLTEHDFSYELGSGISFDIWGNIHLMYSSVNWNLNNVRGVPLLRLDQVSNNIQMGNTFAANVPGVAAGGYADGSHFPFMFEGSNSHITLGRLWMDTFGTKQQSNSDVDFHLVNDNGWFRFFAGVASSDSTFHTISNKDDKYDIALLDTSKSIMAIQNTDFAQFHLKKHNDRADNYQKGVIIDSGDSYSIDNSFVDANGTTLNIMNLVATLGDVVKNQQKQISELNAKLALLAIKD